VSTSEARSGSAPSVRGRLRELARRRGLEFQLVLSEFAIERLLYRLGASSHRHRFVVVRYARPSLDVELRCPWRNPSRSLDRSFPHQSGCASGARSSAEAVSKRPLVVRRFRMSCDASYFPSSRLRGGPATSRRIGQPVVRGRDGDDGPEANYRCRLWCHSSPRTPRRQR
jgi:hypothetical protein